jgi:type IV pilus assembly protein PilY1
VFGLNGGGRSYYAFDITTPTSPLLLWEFSASNDSDLGYTFGNPVVTKKADGTWVVLVTSGYDNGDISGDGSTNNDPEGDGEGYLYVLNAATGTVISKLGTGVGDANTPSGLSKIAAWADDSVANNTALYVYGGDLRGNLWRFDINSPASSSNPLKFATLFSDSGGANAQPITVRPELGKINGKRVVFIGTGKYLEVSDLSNTQQQSIYAILDDNAASTLVNPRTTLTRQTLTTSGATRTATNNAVDFSAGRGWYVDLPDSGERQNVDGKLESGTLLEPTTVPADSVCSPGGYSWMNYFNYMTGGPVDTQTDMVSNKTNAPIVGINVYYINGTPVVSQVTADSPTPEVNTNVPFRTQASSFQKKKVIWRELIQ